jgi:hypothetical protein
MKKLLENFKSWIIIWMWFLLTITIWVFSYEKYYVNIDNVTSWWLLTADTFNQLIENVESLNTRLERQEDMLFVSWQFTNTWLMANSWKILSVNPSTLTWTTNLVLDWSKFTAPADGIYSLTVGLFILSSKSWNHRWLQLNHYSSNWTIKWNYSDTSIKDDIWLQNMPTSVIFMNEWDYIVSTIISDNEQSYIILDNLKTSLWRFTFARLK